MTEDDLEAIESPRVRIVRFRGESIEVRPAPVLRIARASPHVRKLLEAFNVGMAELDASTIDAVVAGLTLERVLLLLESNAEPTVAAIAAILDRKPEWVGDAPLDEIAAMVTAILAVNTDFFVHRLVPTIAETLGELSGVLRAIVGAGPTPSRDLSQRATA